MKPALIVHGGAWDIPDAAVTACKSGCERALKAGWRILEAGGSALDAIEAAVVILEDDPVFDAGYGSHLNLDGKVECDAIVMDGSTLRAGAVATLQHVRNPVRLARKVLEHCPHMMLVAEGAERFAHEQGIKLCANEELVTDAEREAWSKCKMDKHAAAFHRGHEQGTVGAVAIDRNGQIFAATSTGGTCCKLPGRVGDSPLIGCGCYADQEAGGVSCTGYGEAIMKIVMAKTATDFLRCSRDENKNPLSSPLHSGAHPQANPESAMAAARASVDILASRTRATGGLIVLDREGNPGWAFNTPSMSYGYVQDDGRIVTAV
jgi:beta-aspartyl-peptidase (threonine type)